MPHVLVYQIGALGDTIVSIPSYRAIRRHFGKTEIHLLQAELGKGRIMPSDMLLRERLIDGVTSYPHKPDGSSSKDKLSIWRTVLKSKPKAVVYIGPAERDPAMVKRDKLFFRMCGVSKLYGFHGIDYASFGPRNSNGVLPLVPNQARMRLMRLDDDGITSSETDLAVPLLRPTQNEKEEVLDWLHAHRKHPDRKLVAIGVMTAQEATRWPMDRFGELGRKLLADGTCELVVVGGPGDVEFGSVLTQAWSDGIVAAGQLDLYKMAALLSMTDLYIGLDTGTTHLASAVGAKILALYSDHNWPGEWDPLSPGFKLIYNHVPCSGCQKMVCPLPDHPCMTGITVEQVYQAATGMLGGQ